MWCASTAGFVVQRWVGMTLADLAAPADGLYEVPGGSVVPGFWQLDGVFEPPPPPAAPVARIGAVRAVRAGLGGVDR